MPRVAILSCATTRAGRLALAGVLASTLAACAGIPAGGQSVSTDLVSRCERAYRALDEAVARAGVRDAMSAPVPGFPYLRVDRLHASFASEPLSDEQTVTWIGSLQREDSSARLVEIRNLPPIPTETLLGALAREGLGGLPPPALLEGCGRALVLRDLASPARLDALRAAARVPDDYSDVRRAAGLYPLTAHFFAIGIRGYEAETRTVFRRSLDALPVRGSLRTYSPGNPQPLPRQEIAALARSVPRDALGVPRPSPEALDALTVAWAPRFVVDETDGNDRIGMPVRGADGRVAIDTKAAVVFTRATATRFEGRVLLQLVYTAWFPARPARSPGDMLAGHLDGIVWRVTLDEDGEALLFDSIHPCGCYHLFFPTARLVERPSPPGIEEGALVPQSLDATTSSGEMTIRIESGTHALQRVVPGVSGPGSSQTYALAPEDRLRALPDPAGGTRSVYGENGIVPGTERGERIVLWPVGIESPGAMRQWGRHATAFLGRRHFDEAFLVERYFVRTRALPVPVAAAGGPAAPLF